MYVTLSDKIGLMWQLLINPRDRLGGGKRGGMFFLSYFMNSYDVLLRNGIQLLKPGFKCLYCSQEQKDANVMQMTDTWPSKIPTKHHRCPIYYYELILEVWLF